MMFSRPGTLGSAASSAAFCLASVRASESGGESAAISRASLLAGASSRYS
jgi:hypothetical protein